MAEQLQPPAQIDEPPAGGPDRRTIVLPEVGDGLEVRSQPPGQPHQLDVALRLALQPPARRHLVDVAVDIELQQQTRMVARPARRLRNHAREPQRAKIERLDKRLDHPNRVLIRHVVVQELRKQHALPAIFTLDEPLHRQPHGYVVGQA
jgi:hypothetical protein